MHKIILIGLGSGVGGILRYGLSTWVYSIIGRQFPYGTLAVNSIGCLMMGFLFILLLERFDGLGEPMRELLLIGFLGGFTTFSSFSIETMNLLENGESLLAMSNIFFSVFLCLLLTWMGILLGRAL